MKNTTARLILLVLLAVLVGGCQGDAFSFDLAGLFARDETPPPAAPRKITIRIRLTSDDRVILNNESIPLSTIGPELERIARELDNAILSVKIQCDDDVPFGRIRIVRRACTEAGIVRTELTGL